MFKNIKGNLKWWWIIVALSVMVALLASCAGPAGPPGPAGPAGPPGTAVSCSKCHNDTTVVLAKQIQAANSVHMTGSAFERSQKDCAICHTNEGFNERIAAGKMEIAGDIKDPTPPNCRTCHKIHSTFTENDFALRTSDPVKIQLTGDTVDLGKGNICASCHQPRWAEKVPQVGGADIEIKSIRFGPHHGVQSTMVAGVAAYGEKFTGSSVHYKAVKDGCTTCHMANAYGNQAGGHTLNMAYDYHGHELDNVAGCLSCHEGIKNFDRNGLQTDVKALAEELKKLLIAKGIMNPEDGLAKPGKYPSGLVGAFWNYKLVEDDGSHGVHNPQFTKAILKAAIDAAK